MTNQSILIVDDERPLADEVATFFRRKGWHTEAVYDGPSAAHAVKEQSFDVVLLDMRMPGMDGFATLQEIRTVRPGLCVVFFTAFGDVDSAVRAKQEGAWSMLVKGRSPDETYATIDLARIQFAELKEAERQKDEARLARDRMIATRTLAQSITHQVGNRTAQAGFELLKIEEAHDDAERQQGIRDLREALSHLQDTIRNLHDLWRIEAGQFPIVEEELAPAIYKGWGIAKRRMPYAGVELFCSLLEEPPVIVRCMMSMLPQLFENLFHNSMDAVSLHGKVGHIHVTVIVESPLVRIRVSDNGPGFDPKIVGKADMPYESTKGGHGEGPSTQNGLGLYLVKLVVEKAGGTLSYGNSPRRGAFVEFTLPLAIAP
jgi:signal transduction histidine kinase